MTPAEIEAWYREHGGKASEPTKDANGVTTHRAADGQFIGVRANGTIAIRGFSGMNGASDAAQSPAAPAAQPTPPGGGGMDQQQVEQWIAQNGGPGAVQYNRSSQRIKNPAKMRTLADGSDNPDWDPTAPEWIDVQEESWTNSKTGAVLRVSRRPDGATFDVKENKGADPNKPAAVGATIGRVEGTPTGRTNPDGTPEYDNTKPIWVERDANNQQVGPAKPLTSEQRQQWERDKNGGKTDAEIRAEGETATAEAPVPNRPGWVQITTKQGNTTKVQFRGPDNRIVDTLPAEPPKETRQVVTGPDGKTYIRVTAPKADGSTEVYHTDQNGNRVQMPDDPSKQPVRVPASLQGWKPDPTRPGHGLIERRDALMQAAERGEIRYEDVPTILQQDIGLAESVAQQQIREQTESRNLRNEQRADRNTALNVATSRQGHVGNLMQESRAQAQPFVGKVAPPPGSSIAGGAMRTQYELTRAMGGYDVPPDVEMPAFAQNAVRAGQQAAAPTRPNAIGLGSIGNVPAPGSAPAAAPAAAPSPIGAVTRGVTATNTAANNPTGANIDAANQAVQNGFNQAVGPLLAPPPQEGAPEASMPAWGRNAMASVPPAQRLRLLGYPDDVIQEALSRGGMVA